uniref:Ovule protein n=1 Tax=Romanomermis culicivorax TaxID=13658 RepID=A0A915HIY2_ROMCU
MEVGFPKSLLKRGVKFLGIDNLLLHERPLILVYQVSLVYNFLSIWHFGDPQVTTFEICYLVKNILDRHGLVIDRFVNNLPGTE